MTKETMIKLFRYKYILFCLILVVSFRSTILASTVKDSIIPGTDSTINTPTGQAVKLLGKRIFTFYNSLGPFSAADRANALEQKLVVFAEDPLFAFDSLRISMTNNLVNIVYGDEVVTTISIPDSISEQKSRMDIARFRLEKITDALHDVKKYHENGSMIKSLIFSVIILILFISILILLNKLFNSARKRIDSWKDSPHKIFNFNNYEFINKDRQIKILHLLLKVFRLLFTILLVVIALVFMFYLLPWTKFYTMQIVDFIIRPVRNFFHALWAYLPNFLSVCVILFITVSINRLFRFLKHEVEREALNIPGFYPEWALPTYNIIRVIVWIFTIIVIWPYLPGSDSKIFQGISVFVGVLFSLTSASVLSNLMAGFTLTFTRAYKLGDRVKIGEITGEVIEKSMMVTKVKTIKNEEVTIPNSKIIGSEVMNYSSQISGTGLILHTTVTIGYDAPWRTIHQLLINAALATEGLLTDPKPFVLQTSLDDFYISYQINAYTKEPARIAEIYSRLHQNIQDMFNQAGMEIMSPHYKAMRDGNTIAIPEEYRKKEG